MAPATSQASSMSHILETNYSKPEFLGMEFMDSWSESPGHPSEALPVLGGVIGSALYASMSAKQAIDYNNLKSFSFASGGAISWSSN
jgi:hypothetical protein